MSSPLLAIDRLNAWYGHAHVLQGVSLHVDAGEPRVFGYEYAEPTAEGTVAPVDGAAGEQPALPASTLAGGLPAPAGPLVVVPAGCAQPPAHLLG